jgi:hypothetical protein
MKRRALRALFPPFPAALSYRYNIASLTSFAALIA